MAINLIYTVPAEKDILDPETGDKIGTEAIQIRDGFATAAIKNTIHLKYDKVGKCNITSINLGNKNEHRVTWIYFDVSDLLWNAQHIKEHHSAELSSKELNNLYNLYNFKLIFKTANNKLHSFFLNTDKLIDGKLVFEIPRILTQFSGESFKMLLMIEENTNSSNQNAFQHNINDFAGEITSGNLDADDTTFEDEKVNNKNVQITYAKDNTPPPNIVERFVTKEITVSVKDSIYNGEGLVSQKLLLDTQQYDSLIKPSLWGQLTDSGKLTIKNREVDEDGNEVFKTTNVLGQELDSYVKYIKFNADQISANTGELKKYLFFRHATANGYELAYAPFEALQPYFDINNNNQQDTDEADNIHDDLTGTNYDYIVWIPAKVYEYPGQWEICVVAFAGRVPVKPTYNDWKEEQLSYDFERVKTGDHYYCYVSNSINMNVENSFLTKQNFDGLKEWNDGYDWIDVETDENGDPVVDEEGNTTPTDDVTLEKELIYYNTSNDNLVLDEEHLHSTLFGTYIDLRDFNRNTTKISYINGAEIVDRTAREEVANLSNTGIAAMGKAIFSGMGYGEIDGVFTGVEFTYIFGENGNANIYLPPVKDEQDNIVSNNPYLNRMYAFTFKFNGTLQEEAEIQIRCEWATVDNSGQITNVDTKPITILIPKCTTPTVKDFNNHFAHEEGQNTWYFAGYFIEQGDELCLVTTADANTFSFSGGSGSGSGDGSNSDVSIGEIIEVINTLNTTVTQLKTFQDSWQILDIPYQEYDLEVIPND